MFTNWQGRRRFGGLFQRRPVRAASTIARAMTEALESRQFLSVAVPGGYVKVDTLTVQTELDGSGNVQVTTGSHVLESGASYFLKATGTWNCSAWDPRIGDAKFHQEWMGTPDSWVNYGNGLTANGASNWGAFDADHEYGMTLTGNGSVLSAYMDDTFYDDNAGLLTISVYEQVKLTSLTVADATESANSITVSGTAASADFYIEERGDHTATIDISGVITPVTTAAKAKTLWRINEPHAYQSQGNFSADSNHVTLTVVDGNRVWNAKAGVDANNNGSLDEAEVHRSVKVTLVRVDAVSVEDVALRGHKAVADSATVPTYLVMPNADSKVELELDEFGAPASVQAGKHVLWSIWSQNSSEPVHSGNFEIDKPTAVLSSGSTRSSRAFGLEVGFDDDADGELDDQEVSRRIAMTVVLPLVFQATTFIPYEAVTDPTPLVEPVIPDEPFGNVLFHTMLFSGDARINAAGTASIFDRDDTRFRTRQKMTLIPVLAYDRDGTVDGLDTPGLQNLVGVSKHYHLATSISGTPSSPAGGANLTAAAKNDTTTGDLNMLHATATASNAGMIISTSVADGLLTSVTLDMAASNPLETGAPAIDYDAVLSLSYANPNSASYHLTGSHDGFPSYDFFLDDQLIYSHDCITTGQTPASLYPDQEYPIDKRGSLVPA